MFVHWLQKLYMKNVLTDIGLYGYNDRPVWKFSEKIEDEGFVLGQTNTQSMKEYDRPTSTNGIPSFGNTDAIPEQMPVSWLQSVATAKLTPGPHSSRTVCRVPALTIF